MTLNLQRWGWHRPAGHVQVPTRTGPPLFSEVTPLSEPLSSGRVAESKIWLTIWYCGPPWPCAPTVASWGQLSRLLHVWHGQERAWLITILDYVVYAKIKLVTWFPCPRQTADHELALAACLQVLWLSGKLPRGGRKQPLIFALSPPRPAPGRSNNARIS